MAISKLDQQEIDYLNGEIEDSYRYISRLEREKDANDHQDDKERIDGIIWDQHIEIESYKYRIQEILEQYQEDEC